MARRTFSIGGIHPDDAKLSRNAAIEAIPLPSAVYISLAQHIGAPAKTVVAPGDKVKAGQVIGHVQAWYGMEEIVSAVDGHVVAVLGKQGENVAKGEIVAFVQ